VGTTSWTPKSDERDRIDFIFHKGTTIKAKYVAMVGPKSSYSKNALTTSFTDKDNFIADNLPWPSDHKAVFATLTFPFKTVHIVENAFANEINIYPNPGQGAFQLDLGRSYKEIHLLICDVYGKEIYAGSYRDTAVIPLEIKGDAGMYFVSITSGDKRAIRKLIKE